MRRAHLLAVVLVGENLAAARERDAVDATRTFKQVVHRLHERERIVDERAAREEERRRLRKPRPYGSGVDARHQLRVETRNRAPRQSITELIALHEALLRRLHENRIPRLRGSRCLRGKHIASDPYASRERNNGTQPKKPGPIKNFRTSNRAAAELHQPKAVIPQAEQRRPQESHRSAKVGEGSYGARDSPVLASSRLRAAQHAKQGTRSGAVRDRSVGRFRPFSRTGETA